MGRARASIELPVQVSAAEELWYDVSRWPLFVDGFHHAAKVDGDWPHAGARLVWDSVPQGRGRVIERVVRYEVRSGQTVDVEDGRIRGTQTVTFTPRPGGVSEIELVLEYRMKGGNAFTPLFDLFFVRRAMTDALRRTLSRFRREVRAEAELYDALS